MTGRTALGLPSSAEAFDLVLGFLRGIGAEREAEMYLRLFRRGPRLSFAVVEIADDVTPVSLARLAIDLAFLSRLDLFPVVVHGAGVPRRRPRRRGQLTLFAAPDRRARAAIEAVNETLAGAIDVAGGDAETIVGGIFTVETDGPVPDAPPAVVDVRVGRLARAVGRDRIPVVAAIGADASGNLHPIPTDEAARALVARLKPKKYLRLAEAGGLRRADGTVIEYLNLALDAEAIARGRLVRREDRPVLAAVRAVLADSARTTAQLTSPAGLLRELFTTKGAGTLVKTGAAIDHLKSFGEVNRPRLRRLVESSFGRRLARDYFRLPVRAIFLERAYRGVAVVRTLGRFAYLDKFAVRPEARGEGIGNDLWTLVRRRHPRLVWRSRAGNPLNAWYAARADGMARAGRWVVFWTGLATDEIPRAVRAAAAVPPTILDERATGGSGAGVEERA